MASLRRISAVHHHCLPRDSAGRLTGQKQGVFRHFLRQKQASLRNERIQDFIQHLRDVHVSVFRLILQLVPNQRRIDVSWT